jgi:phage terminase large subunit
MLITYATQTPNSEISIVSESIPHLKRGAVKDFIKIMQMTGNWSENSYNKSDMKYRFKNGSYIEFFSVDQPDKLRGARRHVLFINECNNVPFDAYLQLSIRTSKFIYLDYNPSNEFWVHTELIGDKDVDFIILTYKDNEALDESIVREIEKAKEKAKTSRYWQNWWNVYGLGLVGSLDGVIFHNWSQIDSIPQEAKLFSYGMDFGFTNDPTTLVAVYKWNEKLIIDELIYQTKLLNSDIIRKCKELTDMQTYIIADSAEPKSIQEIKNAGIRIKAAEKGKDSINHGIDLLQQYELLITSRSTNLIKEFRNYTWDVDKQGNKLNKPIDDWNHGIDALRYSSESLHKPKVNLWDIG